MANSYGQEGPFDTDIEQSPPWEYEDFISPISEHILGTDILQGQNLQTSICDSHFRLIKPVLRGNANWEPVSLPPPSRVVTVKQYKLRGGVVVVRK